jgi:hypothetical protein
MPLTNSAPTIETSVGAKRKNAEPTFRCLYSAPRCVRLENRVYHGGIYDIAIGFRHFTHRPAALAFGGWFGRDHRFHFIAGWREGA